MMRQLWFGWMVVSVAISAKSAVVRDPVQLKPASPWKLEYAPDSCRLMRDFGDGKDPLLLVLDSYQPGNNLRAMIVGKPLQRHGLTRLEKASLRFGPYEDAQEVQLLAASVGAMPALIVSEDVRIVPLPETDKAFKDRPSEKQYVSLDPPVDPKRTAAVSSLAIRYNRNRELILITGSMLKPLASLGKCAWETVESWGLDVEQQKTLSKKPVGIGVPWLNPSDYPVSLLERGYQGIIRTRLMIDTGGKPTACHIQETTRPKAFDETVCRAFMNRAKFEPALDAKGVPVPSFWSQTIQFRLQ